MRWNDGKSSKKLSQRILDDGQQRWVEKPPSPVLGCACGKRYIKTRRG